MSTVLASKLGSFFTLQCTGTTCALRYHGQTERVGRNPTEPRLPDQRLPSTCMNYARGPEDIKEHFFCIPSRSTSHGIGNIIACMKHGIFIFAVLKECNFTTISFHQVSSWVFWNSWKFMDWLGNHIINKKTLKVVVFFVCFVFKTCQVSKSVLSHCEQKEKKCP